ncbi:MAG: hypothetical protein R2806_07020 [Saprospiraceae bacterium]
MLKLLLIIGTLYVLALVYLTYMARDKDRSSANYLMAGSNVGSFLGLFTFAATLFSTFTILGMPDFFRVHGVGAWIFIAVSDLFMVFGIILVGYHVRKKIKESGTNYYGMAGFMSHCYGARLAGYVVFLGAFLFLIPYVAIQIKGVVLFLDQAFPDQFPMWLWASLMLIVMVVYSELGGLKAIMYSDVLQGILLLLVIWIIGIVCLNRLGGISEMFAQVQLVDEKLLSVPGPKGLFDLQFLIGSMVGIVMIPFTQPQVSTRLVIMRNHHALYRTAVALGFFAILVILPTLFIGMYGAVHYETDSTADFLGKTLITDQLPLIGVLVLLGLIAAAMSTADSQIFGLGAEIRSLLGGEDQQALRTTRGAIFLFAVICLLFSLFSPDELVLLARLSFTGTALMAPMIFLGIFTRNAAKHRWMPWITLVAILAFILSSFGILPTKFGLIRTDLLLLFTLGFLALAVGFVERKT